MKLYKFVSTSLFVLISLKSFAQSNVDANAISTSDPRISQWASESVVQRGWIDIANKSLGYVSVGTDQNAIGPIASGKIVSLGDSGVAVLTFITPIENKVGPDFAVFENAFINPTDATSAFLELAFVEVSSDGINYVRFPSKYLGQDTLQKDNFYYSNKSDYVNLAGIYVAGYGTPFDLEELKDSVGLDVNNITHVRIVDVIGSIDTALGSKDALGNIINDPYPTAFNSGGFDLSGVAVLNGNPNSLKKVNNSANVYISPNPATSFIKVVTNETKIFHYQVVNLIGNVYLSNTTESAASIDVSSLTSGTYYLILRYGNDKRIIKFVKE